MPAVRSILEGDHVEAQHASAPVGLTLPMELRGANELSLFLPGYRSQSAAEVRTTTLPHFHDHEHLVVEAHDVDLAGLAAQIASNDAETLHLQVLGCKHFGRGAALQM